MNMMLLISNAGNLHINQECANYQSALDKLYSTIEDLFKVQVQANLITITRKNIYLHDQRINSCTVEGLDLIITKTSAGKRIIQLIPRSTIFLSENAMYRVDMYVAERNYRLLFVNKNGPHRGPIENYVWKITVPKYHKTIEITEAILTSILKL